MQGQHLQKKVQVKEWIQKVSYVGYAKSTLNMLILRLNDF